MRYALICSLLCSAAFAQDADQPAKKTGDAPEKPEKKGEVEPLPEGQVKVFEAIVMEVKGTAQARATRKEKWKPLKVNDVLKPGAVIRTGRKSYVALRVGTNASLLIERQSRIALPEIIQEGDVLRTRVSMSFGKADVRVDRVGLKNDFEVATPTATLAVRGTVFRIIWTALSGFEAIGVRGNKLRAIEVRYITGVEAALSQADTTSQSYPLPALDAFVQTYFFPLVGAVTENEVGDVGASDPTGSVDNPRQTSDLKAADKERGEKTTGSNGDNPPPPSEQQRTQDKK